MKLYQGLLRPLLFRLPPERAQALAELALRTGSLQRLLTRSLAPTASELRTHLAGIPLRSPVGLAAGFNKDCDLLGPLLRLGFGYVVAGTVTREPRPGNPRPRLLRLPEQQALVNAMGFPSKGLAQAESRLHALSHPPAPVLVSISGLSVEEFLECHRCLEPLADGVELNISSPNTEGLRIFQEPGPFAELVERINGQRTKPLFIKLPPYFDEAGQAHVLALVQRCLQLGVNGVTAINTRPVAEPGLKIGQGGLSGRPLFSDMLRIVGDIRGEAGERLAINACGGISTGAHAFQALQAGASTVQLFTALVYHGPGVVATINRELVELCRQHGLASVDR